MSQHRPAVALPAHILRCMIVVLTCLLPLLGCASAQDSATVPNLVKFSGTVSATPAGTAGVIFALYKDQTGGAPLWQEVQNVTVDSNGHYTSLLGSSTAAGIPLDVFSSNEARWLGVQVQGQAEQSRVLLVSVPYALKAADSETLGGLPASAFLRADAATATPSSTTSYVNTAAVNAAVGRAAVAAISVSGPTIGYLPYFYDASGDLKNSLIAQASGNVGIGTTAPVALLHLLGTNSTMRVEQYGPAGSGDSPNFNFYTANGTSAANATGTLSGDNLGQFAAAGYIPGATPGTGSFPGSKAKVTFVATDNWATGDTGTAMSFQTTKNGTTARTERMRIDNTGNVGIGTPTPAYPLSVNGPIQSLSGGFLFPDGSSLATAVNVPSTATGNTFTGNQSINGSETVSGTVTGNATSSGGNAVFGNATSVSGATGVLGVSSTSWGVVGDSLNPGVGAAGVFGLTQGIFSTTYNSEATVAAAGLWGDTSGSSIGIPVAIFGTADAGYAGAFVNNSADFQAMYVANNGGLGLQASGSTSGISATGSNGDGVDGYSYGGGNGVYGLAQNLGDYHAGVLGVGNTTSSIYGTYQLYSGVWGDTGTSGTAASPAWAVGVLGTADDSHAGVFLNNSATWSTMYIGNYGAGGTGAASKAAGLFATLKASTSTGTCGIGGNGDLTCTGQVKTLATTGGGARTVETYAMQSPENWMEDFGSGTLAHGVAVVQIDPAFAETVSETADYHVFLTPNGDSKGLYVIRKTATSFEVHESGGGWSSLSFDYRIVAKRRGYEGQRMADVTERFKAEQQELKSRLKVQTSVAPSRPGPSPLVPKSHSTPAGRPVPGMQPIAAKPLAHVTRP